MQLTKVLHRPVISEKSTMRRDQSESSSTAGIAYTFQVAPKATKLEIKKAINQLFEVKVESVRTNIRRGKVKRRGVVLAKSKLRKFAVVTLAKGEKIAMFEEN